MKPLLFFLLALVLASLPARSAPPASAPEPTVIEGLGEMVYRYVHLTSVRNRTNEYACKEIGVRIMADDQIDEHEARLIAALAGDQFSILLRPEAGKNIQPAEVRFAGKMSDAGRAVLRNLRPLDYRAVLSRPDLAGLTQLAAWLPANAARRAEARAWFAAELEAARLREPFHPDRRWDHYRNRFDQIAALALTIPGRDGDVLVQWVYEAALLHDRQQADAVPDFLYTWSIPVEDQHLRAAAVQAIDAILPLPAP